MAINYGKGKNDSDYDLQNHQVPGLNNSPLKTKIYCLLSLLFHYLYNQVPADVDQTRQVSLLQHSTTPTETNTLNKYIFTSLTSPVE